MIKRLSLLLAVVLTASSLFAAIETYTQSIPVSFTYDIVANYGFTKKRVNDYVKPVNDDVAGPDINFKYDSAKKQLKTDDFYFYYQIFTPDAVTITMKLDPLKNGEKVVSYSSVDKYDFASDTDEKKLKSGKTYEIYHADKFSSTTAHFSPVVSSTLLCFVVDDISKVVWDAEYNATVTLSMVVS